MIVSQALALARDVGVVLVRGAEMGRECSTRIREKGWHYESARDSAMDRA